MSLFLALSLLCEIITKKTNKTATAIFCFQNLRGSGPQDSSSPIEYLEHRVLFATSGTYVNLITISTI
jgi:hypothetical protein